MAKSGGDTLVILQVEDKQLQDAGCIIGGLTEDTHSIENELADEQTKFGRILAYGPTSETIEFTAYVEDGDVGQKEVVRAIKDKKEVKVWLVDKKLGTDNQHDAVFARTLVESVERENPGDGFSEISGTLQVIGTSKTGKLPKLPDSVLNAGSYDFEVPGASTGPVGNIKKSDG